jgi:hypothetical protein
MKNADGDQIYLIILKLNLMTIPLHIHFGWHLVRANNMANRSHQLFKNYSQRVDDNDNVIAAHEF